MSLAYDALDKYNDALQSTKFLEDEQLMAEAKAKIGHIIFKILKNNNKARSLLYDSNKIVFKEEN